MAAGVVDLSKRTAGHSGHFPAISLCEDTDTTIGMNSFHPVPFSSSHKSRANYSLPSLDKEDTRIDHTVQKLFACMSIAYNGRYVLYLAPMFFTWHLCSLPGRYILYLAAINRTQLIYPPSTRTSTSLSIEYLLVLV